VIFIHNHPSGETEASDEDIRLTKRLAEVGELVGISVLDHVIIGGKNFSSMKQQGLF
jgi:DNA repair protein RadC